MKNMDNFCYEGKPSHASAKLTLFTASKDEWDTKKTVVSPRRTHCAYCNMPKGTSRAKGTLSSENIKPVALAVIDLRLSEASVGQ